MTVFQLNHENKHRCALCYVIGMTGEHSTLCVVVGKTMFRRVAFCMCLVTLPQVTKLEYVMPCKERPVALSKDI